jgi:NADP-reducing hydrogenase subunit HndB
MNTIRSLDDLQQFRNAASAEEQRQASRGLFRVVVSLGSCGIAAGALDTLRAIQAEVEAKGMAQVLVSQAGCAGLCRYEPVVEVIAPDGHRDTYGRVTPDAARRILREHVLGGAVVQAYLVNV